MMLKVIPKMPSGKKLGEEEAGHVRLRRQVRDRAHRESLRVPWKHFADTLANYVQWSRYCLWVRTTLEADNTCLTPELEQSLAAKVPGFLDLPRIRRVKGPRATVRFWLALVKWVDEHYFSEARRQGWNHALGWYAAEQSDMQKAWYYWQEQEDQRKAGGTVNSVPYDEWTSAVERCPELIRGDHPKVRVLDLVAQAKVDRERLILTVERYIHHAAFVQWAGAIEGATEDVPPFLSSAVLTRWPDCDVAPYTTEDRQFWRALLAWVEETFFPEASSDGWLTALQFFADQDIYYQRIRCFSLDCEERWTDVRPVVFPPFERWIQDVDSYTETA